jgi:predicted dehydrogenase
MILPDRSAEREEAASRREFLQRAVLAGIGMPLATRAARAAVSPAPHRSSLAERLRIGIIGTNGRGAENARGVASEDIVALCDIDERRLAEAKALYPKAATYKDFRALLDAGGLDAVVISTPDHMHAIPAVRAMAAGIDVYCEKPLAHSVWEVRRMRDAAKQHGRITQMGTQIHAGDNYRRVVEIIRSNRLGKIHRVHVWMNGKPIPRLPSNVPQVCRRVTEGMPPPWVDYDLWLGPAPYRPFHPSHFHFNWRYWFDFGGGMLADFGCHYMDLPHWALDLRAPTTVEATGELTLEGDSDVPTSLRVDYHHPARGDLPPLHLTWYHGDWRPEGADVYGRGSAVLFEGENGRLVSDYSTHRIYVDREVEGRSVTPIPTSIGHHEEWIAAVKNRGATTCNFDYSGALAETVLLGNVAYRTGRKIEWDDASLHAVGCPEANEFIRRDYRKGWEL